MRILFITPELPNRLHRVRALNLLRGLSARHTIDLVSLTHRPPDAAAIEPLGGICRRVDWALQPRWRSLAQSALGLLSQEPLESWYERSPILARLIEDRLAAERYDLVYVKRLRMAQYGSAASGMPRILDLTDSMTRFYDQAWRRAPWPAKALCWEEWLKHRRFEPRAAAQYDRCVIASPVDLEYLRIRFRLQNIDLVPNSVDTDYFTPRPSAEEPCTFLLSGLMDKLVNVDAVLHLCGEIWPRVRAGLPTARLRLVGPAPVGPVRALDGHQGIEVVGYVPDLRDEIARATAVLVPLRLGTGTKNKILQSLAMGRAVVTTSVGNEGLGATHGEQLIVADDPGGFAAAIVDLHAHPARRAALGRSGRAWVLERYGIPAMIGHLEPILAAVVDQAAARSGRGG